MAKFSLDQLYKMTSHVYAEQNFHRPISATFLHFVEVCGMLTALARKKKREAFSFEDSICKSLGWLFPLLAKCGVNSVEKLVFRKFPYVCPYCRKCPHVDFECKAVRGTDQTVDHPALRQKVRENSSRTPKGLNEWQQMFQDIYPRAPDTNRSAIGLMEELGELAEAIRVFERHPRFLAGEVADVFSYLMGLANEFNVQKAMSNEPAFDFEQEYLRRYPGVCIACGNPICTCPSVPPATIGRMAKELELDPAEALFSSHFDSDSGQEVSSQVLASVGGLDSVVSYIPLDKGQISSSITLLCHRLGDAIRDLDASLAMKLKTYANSLANNQTAAGQQHSKETPPDVVAILAEAFRLAVANKVNVESASADGLGYRLVEAASRLRVLLIGVSAIGEDRINIERELREVKAAIERSRMRDLIDVEELVGATIDQLRRKLLEKEFTFLHFFGHGFEGGLVLSGHDSGPKDVGLEALRALVKSHTSIKGVLLNSCDSLRGIDKPIGQFTIGMEEQIEDRPAIDFAVGFYDAVGAGSSVERAIEEGVTNVKLHHDNLVLPIKVLHKNNSMG